MELFANDLSIHGQFHDISSFRDELARLMAMRNVAQRFGREVYCHRALLTANPIPNMSMQQALGRLRESERRAAMSWLTRGGPFWMICAAMVSTTGLNVVARWLQTPLWGKRRIENCIVSNVGWLAS